MTIVCCAGFFDGLHDGHRSHFKAARALGDKLVAITHSDARCIAKKGFVWKPLEQRVRDLKEAGVDEVVVAEEHGDLDGTVANTLRYLRPSIFAKGGDRSPQDKPLPQCEIDACNDIACLIVYNVGEPKRPEWSSTLIGRRALGLDKEVRDGNPNGHLPE